ncbi:RdgB/HAM1 family non-canonical purine NTP pyrophosphatase [Desertibaculum subflavum]|uniref:RdgB/HAM1 family non-canonical purine NTP pyrophosphatase n=1 Tax=Desertibaculum subflavum TaxID=2268458 RepID=UPI000E66A9B2
MSRKFDSRTLLVASHNPGKVREIRELLAPFGVETISAGEKNLPEPEETGLTFEANAELKALAAATASGIVSLADDSGLEVDALDLAPGIYSARWAGPDKDFARAMQEVWQKTSVSGKTQPFTCRFVAALTLAWPDGHMETFRGTVEGTLVWPPRGTRGFGYDPMFLPLGRTETFGEMDQDAKHAISHRAVAFRKLIAACFEK